jgi:ABC-type transporter Mla maintaining outer membrane lipid asymmetry ATPase subunit MlaF
MKTLVEKVFVTEGVPEVTFVQPPNFNEILVDIRRSGKPVVIEGQSGTGKTTCVKKILEQLGGSQQTQYLTARQSTDLSKIEGIVRDRPRGTYIIDDFHRLADELKVKLADLAKLSAEQSATENLPKLVLIGINQVGSDLIQLVPDIAKRTGIHRIQPGTQDRILKLISAGCKALNIIIKNPDLVFEESKGDYWLTQ